MSGSRLLRSRLASATPRLSARDDRATEHLQFIRETMERAGSFTAVSGVGQTIVGVIGLFAAWIAGRQATQDAWLATWVGTAALCAGVAAAAIRAKARRLGIPLYSGLARRFALTFLTPLVSGAVLTLVLYLDGMTARLPGTWLLLFGTAVVTGGALSVGVVPLTGVGFIAAAGVAFALPAPWGNLVMAAGFGLLNIVFGLIIAVKHGG
ncbi:MAG TPA: hypothetical protein VGK32_05185 [Vicinamibacterales bacterium]|jgi:hypothetical protein